MLRLLFRDVSVFSLVCCEGKKRMEKVECTCCTQACKSANVAMRDSYMVDAY